MIRIRKRFSLKRVNAKVQIPIVPLRNKHLLCLNDSILMKMRSIFNVGFFVEQLLVSLGPIDFYNK
jgi:hypothetical protein